MALVIGVALTGLAVVLLLVGAMRSIDEHRTLVLVAVLAASVCGGVACLLCFLGRTRSTAEHRIGVTVGIVAALASFAGLSLAGWHGMKLGLAATRKVLPQLQSSGDSDSLDQALRPIPQNPEALTFTKVLPFYEAWSEKNLVAPFEAHATGDAARDEAIRTMIRGWTLLRVGADTAPEIGRFEEWKKASAPDGELHPFAHFVMGTMGKTPDERRRHFEQAVREFAPWPDAAVALFLARLELWHTTQRKTPGAEKAVLDALRAALATPINADDHWAWQHLLAEGPGNDLLEEHGEKELTIIEAAPSLEPWLKHRLRGRYEVALAWNARGSGWATEVNKQGWGGFNSHLTAARQHLEKSWTLNPKHPGAAAGMIAVAMGSSSDPENEMRQWFDRATTARLDYSQAYQSYRWGIRPRWHGSHDALLEFGRACLATGRFDTWVPWEYYRSIEDIASEWDEPEAYYVEEAEWDDLKRLVEGYIAAATTAKARRGAYTRAAILADRCQETGECRRYLEAAEFELDASLASSFGVQLTTWLPRISAQTGPAAEAVNDAALAEGSGDFPTALAALAKAAETPGLDGPARTYIEQRISQMHDLSRLGKAPWEPLVQGGGLAGWKRGFGSPKVVEGNTVEVRSSLMLIREEPVGATFELRGEVELAERVHDIIGGFALGNPSPTGSDFVSASLRRKEGKMSAFYAQRYWDQSFIKRPRFGSRAKVYLRVAAGRLVLHVDGVPVLDRPVELPSALADTSRLALIAPLRVEENTIRWQQLELRRVAKEPAR